VSVAANAAGTRSRAMTPMFKLPMTKAASAQLKKVITQFI
jgi:hypothetical protein